MRVFLLLLLTAFSGCVFPTGAEPDRPEPVAPRAAAVQDWTQLLGEADGYRDPPDTIRYCHDCYAIEWQTPINPGPHSAAKGSAIVVEEVIYIGGDDGVMHAFALDGTEIWQAQTRPSANGIHGTPAVLGDLVFIGAYEGSMFAYDRHNGSLVWEHDLGGSIGSSPRIHDGVLFIAVETPRPSGIMYALDPADGRILWEDHGLANHPHSPAAVDAESNIVLVGANDGLVYAWNATTGQRLWEFHATADELVSIKGPMVVHEGTVYFASWDRNVYAVDVETGQEIWRFRTDGKSMSGVALAPELGLLYVGSHDGHLYALQMDDGVERWRFKTGWLVMGTPTVSNNTVLFGSRDAHFYALDARTGERLWRITAVGGVDTTPLIVGDRVVFASRRSPDTETPGHLYMVAPRSG